MRRVVLALLSISLGCNLGQSTPLPDPGTPSVILPPTIPSDVFKMLKAPAPAHEDLCTADDMHPMFPDDADLLTKVFCQDKKPGGVMPAPQSLADLLKLLDIDFKDPGGGNGTGGNPGFALLGHSSAFTARKVSTLTPTAFIFTPPPADGSKPKNFAFLAFDPGEQFVEVAVDDPVDGSINFYLVLFDKACGANCGPVDLLTPNLVKGWSNVRIYEDETEINNSIADCHVCHDPQNTGDKILRMQEIEPPFTHWFSTQTEGGRALLADFHKAHGTGEDYGPIPAALIDKSDPSLMAKFISQAGFAEQPNAFKSAEIEAEIKTMENAQPAVNTPMGWSSTWENLYNNAVNGQFIATPYHDVKITDPVKLDAMTTAYQNWLGGRTQTLPDIREVFLDGGLRDMGFAPKEGLDGRTLLKQMCQECHSVNLDPMVTRDRFLIDQLDQMTRDEKNLAIERINTPLDTILTMPPTLFRTVTPKERDLMIQELRK
jgi:hypothetical protein